MPHFFGPVPMGKTKINVVIPDYANTTLPSCAQNILLPVLERLAGAWHSFPLCLASE